MARTDILFPTGRIVAGNLYKPNTQDAEGRPLVYKTGAQKDQPRVDYFFALAIPKGAEQHWAQTEWGAKIWLAGHTFMANAGQMPTFAWKVTDGDSQIPNRKGHKPCDREGYKGHWVVALSSSYAPRIYNRDGTQVIVEVDAVKPGYFVQVYGNVDGNASQQQPGVFINHSMVSLQGYGPEIVFGPDATAVGFGAGALPAGASAVPVGGAFNPVPPVPAMPAMPPVSMPAPAPMPAGNAYPSPPAMGVPVGLPGGAGIVPNPAILQMPAMPVAPPAAPVGPRMTATAQGTYEAYRAAGWTDAQLIQHGFMLA